MATVTRDRYDAILVDLDGTLLDGAGKVSPRTRIAVDRVRDLGYEVVLATGRSLSGAKTVHDDLGLDTDVVCYNGAWIGPADGGEPFHYAPIPDGLVPAVEAAESTARFLFRHRRHAKFTRRPADDEHRHIAGWYTNVVLVDGPGALPREDLIRVSLFFADGEATDAAWGALPDGARDLLHREVFPMRIFPEFEDVGLHLCEVQRKGEGKAEAFRFLSERLGIPATRVVAVGDQANDVRMLEGAGLAVAMGNAVPAARAVSDVVIGDHRDEGFARFLEDEVG